jgi:hypothetical protein
MIPRKIKLPVGYIGTAEVLSRLGGRYRKSSVAALVASGKIAGERTPGGHWRFRDDATLAKDIDRLNRDPSAQRRARRAETHPRRYEQPSPEALAKVEAFARLIGEKLLEMYFDGRDWHDLNSSENAELFRRLKFFWSRVEQSVRTRPPSRWPDSPRV